jgi:hypothetical protein
VLNILKRAIDPYMMRAYPTVPDFAATPAPSRTLAAHMTRIDLVRDHNLRAVQLQGRAIYSTMFGVGLLFLVAILVEVT